MVTDKQVLRQTLLLKIEQLSETKLQELLTFVQFLLIKDTLVETQITPKPSSQPEILAGLKHIREESARTYGVYQGDLVAEARAERSQHMDLVLGMDG